MASSASASVYPLTRANKDQVTDHPDNPNFGFDLSWHNAAKAYVQDNPIGVPDNQHKWEARH